MNQTQIGRFIAECRKEKNLTQMQLAEKLNLTNRAVSKWETGKSMPDASIMIELCDILNITVTELLRGQRIETERIQEQSEIALIDLLKCDKRMQIKKCISEIMGGGGTGILLSVLYAPDTARKAVMAVLGFGMICFGWYYRNMIEKNKFLYPSKTSAKNPSGMCERK